ncbi:MAG: alpha/beta hydrolase [Acidimicrobiaceae bacterium]|nr:alpha/beta hydrolase [Acidimicrobiaceae bacterium]
MKEISLAGHPTWALVPKKGGDVVVLLHGGMSSSASMLRSIGPNLAREFHLAAFDRRGHGGTADTDEPFSFESMAEETISFLEYLGRPAHLVGHSDGGNVALLSVLQRPDLVRRAVLIGANYHFGGLFATPQIDFDTPDFLEWSIRYGELSPNGVAHAKVMAMKSERMLKSGPTLEIEDLRRIEVPVLVMAGDDDVARLEHTCSMYENIPDAQLAIVPGASHALLKERTKECSRIVTRFLRASQPVSTLMPIRRAANDPSK